MDDLFKGRRSGLTVGLRSRSRDSRDRTAGCGVVLFEATGSWLQVVFLGRSADAATAESHRRRSAGGGSDPNETIVSVLFARFDHMQPGVAESFGLSSPLAVRVAYDVDEVVSVLSAVERDVSKGRWVAGWVGYESAPGINRVAKVKDPRDSILDGLPLAWFGVFEEREATAGLPSRPYSVGLWASRTDEHKHGAQVAEVQKTIRSGNVYQVNLTHLQHGDFDGDAMSLYRDLIRAQGHCYGAYIETDRWQVLSASPELFFEWRDGVLVSRPMKGTARRGRDILEDTEMRRGLLHSPKERAENVMIVDMVRNDLGRVARPGSVTVEALCATERYETVWQMTSTVSAIPREDSTLVDVFAALFPPASITGAPKIAAMDLISRLEPDPRGVYCGAIGFGGPGADGTPQWRFSVGIRTVLVEKPASSAFYGTGGGITIDSVAHDEFREAQLKMEVLGRSSTEFELLETMGWTPVAGFGHLQLHLDRLRASAEYFEIPLDGEAVRRALDEAVGRLSEKARIRLTVSRGGEVRVGVGAFPEDNGPVRLALDDVPVDPTDPFLRHKTTNRALYEAARARHRGVDDVVLVNERGEVTETTIGNLVVKIGGRWLTPPVDSGCLPGVQRAHLIATGKIAEQALCLSDLEHASGLARVNSLRGWQEACIAE